MAALTLLVFIGFLIIITISSLCGGRTLMSGEPEGVWILALLWLFYSSDLQKDKKEMARRCFLALPFSLLTVVLTTVSGFEMNFSCISGLMLLYALMLKAKNIKVHYIVTLVTVSLLFVCAIIFKGYITSPRTSFIALGCGFGVLVFYKSYATKLERTQDIPALWPTAIASTKFAVACFTAVILLVISHILCRKHDLSLAVSFTISVLIALSLLAICRVFSIRSPTVSGISEKRRLQKKNRKKNRINKLHDELDDFYMEELKSTRRKD